MTVQRGDVVLARVPHTAGTRGKKRPAVAIQANGYNATLRHVVVAEVTSNPRWVSDPACVFIDVTTPEGQATGLHQNGVVSCLPLNHHERRPSGLSGRYAVGDPAATCKRRPEGGAGPALRR